MLLMYILLFCCCMEILVAMVMEIVNKLQEYMDPKIAEKQIQLP